MPEIKDINYWEKRFLKDRDDQTRLTWLANSCDARDYMENNFDPMVKEGLINTSTSDTAKPWLKISFMRPRVLSVYGKLHYNPVDPGIQPFEGESLEEAERMIANAIFKYEMTDSRGPDDINLMEELRIVAMDALVDGFGVSNHIGDPTLMDKLFIYGRPLHYRVDPQFIVFDSRALRLKYVHHQHIITPYLKDDLISIFEIDENELPGSALNLSHPEEELYDVIETQWKEVGLIKTYILTEDQAKYFKLESPIIDAEVFEPHLKALNKQGAEFKIKKLMSDLPSVKRQDWITKSVVWMQGREKALIPEQVIGTKFSTEVLGFFPIQQSAYFNGMPYFLKSPQNMEVILRTIQLRTVIRMENPGAFVDSSAVAADPESMRKLEANEIGAIIKLNGSGEGLDKVIKVREYGSALQYLRDLILGIKQDGDDQFGTGPETRGSKSFSQESGKFAEAVLEATSFLFVHFVDAIERYWPRVFRRILDLADEYYPKEILVTMAGENFQDRLECIMSGRFHDRIQRVNVRVKMDMTTPADRAMARQMVADMVMQGAIAPLTAFRELNFREPERMARELDEWMARRSKTEAMTQLIDKNPALGKVIDAAINKYNEITQGNTAQVSQGQ